MIYANEVVVRWLANARILQLESQIYEYLALMLLSSNWLQMLRDASNDIFEYTQKFNRFILSWWVPWTLWEILGRVLTNDTFL